MHTTDVDFRAHTVLVLDKFKSLFFVLSVQISTKGPALVPSTNLYRQYTLVLRDQHWSLVLICTTSTKNNI